MRKDIVFSFSSNTLEGYPVIGMGICDVIHKENVLNIFSRINKIALGVDASSDELSIDIALKEKIASISPDYILGLALSVNIPEASGPTGGIIGNPNYSSSSANGYSVAALPGGPGLFIKADESITKNIFTDIVIGQNKIIPINMIENIFNNHNIDIAIIVKDGTGSNEHGMIISYYYGEIGYLRI